MPAYCAENALTIAELEEEAGYLRNLATILFHAGHAKDAPEWMHAHLEGLYRIASYLDGYTPEVPAVLATNLHTTSLLSA